MITIWLRELSTYNNGYSIDKQFDLDDYVSSNDILAELFTYTKEKIEELDPKNLEYYNFEEWMISDYELDDGYISMKIGEYDSIDTLLEINESLTSFTDDDKVKYIALLERGYDHEEAIDRFEDCNIYQVEDRYNPMTDLAYDFVEEGYFGEILDSIKIYLDYEKIGRDLEMNGTYEQVDYDANCYLVEVN